MDRDEIESRRAPIYSEAKLRGLPPENVSRNLTLGEWLSSLKQSGKLKEGATLRVYRNPDPPK